MSPDQRAFQDAIDANPLDEAPRMVYADWLDEHDDPDEATRQRQWVGAFHFLKTFTREWDDHCDYEEDGKDEEGFTRYKRVEKETDEVTIKNVLSEIDWWKDCVSGKEQRYGLGGSIGFSTDDAPDRLQDSETRREFWRCFQVLTGVEAPEDLRNQERYRCAC